MGKIQRILISTDLSDPSQRAIDAGAEMAQRFEAEVILCYVVEDHIPTMGMIEFSGVQMAEIEKAHREAATEHLKTLAEPLEKRGLSVRRVVPLGVPHREIVELARKLKVDMIVMGTHGRGFVSRLVLGSTTDRVLRHAPCPVYVVRDPG